MVVALISLLLDWTLFAVFMVFCFSLGTAYITRNGRTDVFGTIDFGADALFIIALFVVVMAVISPFVVLWALGRWAFQRFSSECRPKHGHGNGQVEKTRQTRRLLASRQRAAKRDAASESGT